MAALQYGRTKVTQTYKETGNLRTAQLSLWQTQSDNPGRYPGVELEDGLATAEAEVIKIRCSGSPAAAAQIRRASANRDAAV